MAQPADLRRAAYHEAGHAVGYFVAGWPLSPVGIEPSKDSLGVAMRDRASRPWFVRLKEEERETAEIGMLCVALAGVVAEDTAMGARPTSPSGLEDLTRVYRALTSMNGRDRADAMFNDLYGVVKQTLQDRWPQVEAIAMALLERQHLTAAEIRAIMVATLGDGRAGA